jgi:hypothetical protein
MSTKLVGASVWEQGLYDHLVSHEDNERGMLVEYQDAAATSRSPAFRYLASLIVEDEMRHHRVLRELASALKADAEFRPEEPAVPRLGHWGDDAAHIVELTGRLLAREHADARELHRLAGEFKDVRHTTLWQLLVRLMEMDTAKHIEILDFVKRHAAESAA